MNITFSKLLITLLSFSCQNNEKIYMKMLDGSLLFKKHAAKWTQNAPKLSKAEENPKYFLAY